MSNPDPYSPPSASTYPLPAQRFQWWPALVGGFVVMGASAFFGTVVVNVGRWLLMLQGLSLQAANAQVFADFPSPLALLSLTAAGLSGAFGGYVSASLANGHRAQGAAAGIVGSAFYVVMVLGPSGESASA